MSGNVETELREIVLDVTGAPVDLDDPAVRALSLWHLGLTSSGMVRLLASVEDRLGIAWDLDTSPAVLGSFTGLLAYVEGRLAA